MVPSATDAFSVQYPILLKTAVAEETAQISGVCDATDANPSPDLVYAGTKLSPKTAALGILLIVTEPGALLTSSAVPFVASLPS